MPVDLILIVVIFSALNRGPIFGLWTGTFGGFVQDLLSGGIIGISGLTKSVIGVLLGFTGSHFLLITMWHRAAVVFVASLIHSFLFLLIYEIVGSPFPNTDSSWILLIAMFNVIVGLVFEILLRFISVFFGRMRWGRSVLNL
jgi:rod shape-determining protein MreD